MAMIFLVNELTSKRVDETEVFLVNELTRKFSCKRAQSRTCSGYAECSRKSQRKRVDETEVFLVNELTSKRDNNVVLIIS